MGPVADDVFERMLRQRAVFLRDALDGTNADAAIAQMLHLDGQEPALEITLYVNCPRADLRSALAVYDIIQTVRPAVRTVCLGTAAGGAALVLAGGAEGKRAALPNARITLYEPRRELRGTVGELDVQARELLRLRQQVHEQTVHGEARLVTIGRVRVATFAARRQLLVRRLKVRDPQTDLLQVVLTLRTTRGLAGGLHRGQQQRHQDADDGNHHQQLDQRKAATAFSHIEPPQAVASCRSPAAG